MGDIDAAGEGVHVRMEMALGLEQADAAGKDEIGAGEESALQHDRVRRGARKCGELVHAVVNHQRGADMVGELQRQWSEIVQHGTPDPLDC